jgi:microcystin-dependent protein
MTEPTTSNVGFIVPNTGDLSGAWGTAALNPNFGAIDGYVGGQLTLSVSGATTITLTTASATLTPTAGPYQSANSIITITGSQTGTSFIQLTQPGVYRFFNQATNTTVFPVVVQPAIGTGNQIGLPPGEFWQVGFNGTSCFYIGMPHVGAYMDLAVATTPAWMNACSVTPWLPCFGYTAFISSIFPALNSYLGSTFGGNGITTFGVPDFQSRVNLPLDIAGTGRVTSGGSGINGSQWGASGGNQFLQQHNHANTLNFNDPGHEHETITASGTGGGQFMAFPGTSNGVSEQLDFATSNSTTGISVSINNAPNGSGSSQNMPPALVGGIRFIKT